MLSSVYSIHQARNVEEELSGTVSASLEFQR